MNSIAISAIHANVYSTQSILHLKAVVNRGSDEKDGKLRASLRNEGVCPVRACLKIHVRANRLVIKRIEAM